MQARLRSVRIADDLWSLVGLCAEAKGCSVSHWIRSVLIHGVKKQLLDVPPLHEYKRVGFAKSVPGGESEAVVDLTLDRSDAQKSRGDDGVSQDVPERFDIWNDSSRPGS